MTPLLTGKGSSSVIKREQFQETINGPGNLSMETFQNLVLTRQCTTPYP